VSDKLNALQQAPDHSLQLFNYSYEPVTISYPYADSRSLLDSQKLKTSAPVTIEPWGVVIGEEIKKQKEA